MAGGPGAGWVHGPRGAYRLGGRPPGPDPYAGMAWEPPPIPGNGLYYDPSLDVQEAQGKQGSEQAINSLERQKANSEGGYATNITLLQQREAQEAQQQKETLARLAESYSKLGARQGEQANRLGVVGGGALISAATKRSANENVQRTADQQAFARQAQADQNERGRLATTESQAVGPGGSLTEGIQNAQSAQQLFESLIGSTKAHEAAGRGYVPPTRPWIHTKRGSFRVGGPH